MRPLRERIARQTRLAGGGVRKAGGEDSARAAGRVEPAMFVPWVSHAMIGPYSDRASGCDVQAVVVSVHTQTRPPRAVCPLRPLAALPDRSALFGSYKPRAGQSHTHQSRSG